MRLDPSTVVITRLIGGLGNQMFQYAAGRAVAERHGVPLLLDVSGFKDYDLRRYELNVFAIFAGIAGEEQLTAIIRPPQQQGLWGGLKKRLIGALSQSVLQEASFTYDARIEAARPPLFLDGYWQSEKYFAHLAPAMRREFTLKSGLDQANIEMLRQIKGAGSGAVSLHIRRGDYVNNPHTAQYHGVCSLDYYRAAVQRMSQRVASPHFFVFSDDHAWVQTNLDLPHATTLVQVNDAEHGMFDMELMKSCGHHIIANSSFSWWGAWLNPSPDKVVIAPLQWFREPSNDTRDLLPPAWIRL